METALTEVLLTSFGLSHLPRRDTDNPDIFYRLPPTSMAHANSPFMPDYAVLLLCDRIILDAATYDRLINLDEDGKRYFGPVAETMKALRSEGFLRLEDFTSVVAEHRELLERMLERDVKELEQWVKPLEASMLVWTDFVESFSDSMQNDLFHQLRGESRVSSPEHESLLLHTRAHLHGLRSRAVSARLRHHLLVEQAVESSRKRRKSEYRQALRQEVEEHLSYVNANLVLCQVFSCGLHDWYDFQPFYRDKFLRIGREHAPAEKEGDCVRRLFDVSFPELTFWDPKSLISALRDKRIDDLRRMVAEAVSGKKTFDREFANSVVQEVVKVEMGIGRVRNFVSYATMPLGFIPVIGTPLQKAAEEVISRPIEMARRKPFQWYYLISEMAAKATDDPGRNGG